MELSQEEILRLMGWYNTIQVEGHFLSAADELLFEKMAMSGTPQQEPCFCCEIGCCSDPGHCCQNHTCGIVNDNRPLVSRWEPEEDKSDTLEQFCCPSCKRLS